MAEAVINAENKGAVATPHAEPFSPFLQTFLGGVLVAAAPVLVFYAGWMFLWTYLRPFGIQVSELGLDAWQISALALSGLNTEASKGEVALDLDWLVLMVAAVVLWALARGPQWLRYPLRVASCALAIVAVLAFLGAQQRLVVEARSISESILEGNGALFVPFVSKASMNSEIGKALGSCIEGDRLKPVFISGLSTWSFCRSRDDKRKAFVFVTDSGGMVVSMRRLNVR